MRFKVRFVAFCSLATTLITVQPAAGQSNVLMEVHNGAISDRLVVDSSGALLVTGELYKGSTVLPPTGPGARLIYYPRKAALRAGYVASNQWNETNTGLYSAALGYNTSAAAQGSFAAAYGDSVSADATGGVALGYYSNTSGYAASSLGHFAEASGTSSIALGHYVLASGTSSAAFGSRASTDLHSGAIVIGDASASDSLKASANNQFSVRAAGGYRLFSSSDMTTGVTMAAGASSWGVVSDRNRKHDFLAVDGEALLGRLRSLPVTTWRFRAEENRNVRHIGPMAQDWEAAFGFSGDTTMINMSDLDGVNLAGVKALEERTHQQQALILEQERRIRALEKDLAELRTLVAAERRLGGPTTSSE